MSISCSTENKDKIFTSTRYAEVYTTSLFNIKVKFIIKLSSITLTGKPVGPSFPGIPTDPRTPTGPRCPDFPSPPSLPLSP